MATLALLLAWAGLDQARFILGTNDHDLSALVRAGVLNPYDSSVQRRTAPTRSNSRAARPMRRTRSSAR